MLFRSEETGQYVIRDVNLNFTHMVATTPHQTSGNVTGGGDGYLTGGVRGQVGAPNQHTSAGRFTKDLKEVTVDAKNIVHLSLSEGLDNNFPFGNSLLESIFKVYKQKELLEDAIIIYRVQRAPERRVFYVDVGNMPSHLAMQFVERVKTDIHQRRIPSSSGGGQNVIDSAYNPLSINEDYFFPQTAEGRGSKVEKFENKGVFYSIKDKNYFKNKKVCIFGGGDSALDWAIELSKLAEVILVHRRNEFRGAGHSAQIAKKLEKEGKLKIKTPFQINSIEGENKIDVITIKSEDGKIEKIATDCVLGFFGLIMKLGPIAEWGLNLEKKNNTSKHRKFSNK